MPKNMKLIKQTLYCIALHVRAINERDRVMSLWVRLRFNKKNSETLQMHFKLQL